MGNNKINLSQLIMIVFANSLAFFVAYQMELQGLFIILIFFVLSLAVTGIIMFITNKKVYGLIKDLENSFLEFNEGNFTSTIKLDTKQQELLSIVEEFDKLKKMMNTWIYELLNSSVSIKLSAGKISESSEDTSKSMINFNESLSEINKYFQDTTSMLNDIARATTQLALSSNNIAQSSRSAVNEARQANALASNGGESMNQVYMSMNQIKGNVMSTYHTIENLEHTTKKIESITDTISSISKQTNMLALNAAIESARAGEQGKGFAVVAEEVRKLSDETNSAANQINQLILTVKEEVSNGVNAMKEVCIEVDKGVDVTDDAKEKLISIIKTIENTVDLIESISNDVTDQSQGTELISENTSIVAEKSHTGTQSVNNIVQLVEEQLKGVKDNEKSAVELLNISDNLERIMSTFDITLGKQMIQACSYIANLYSEKELGHDDLLRLCREMGLSEIHIIDKRGEIIQTNNKDILGFKFNNEDGSQTAEFFNILNNPTVTVNQKASFRDVDGKLFKYTGISMINKKGIIQCGLDASKMYDFIGVAGI